MSSPGVRRGARRSTFWFASLVVVVLSAAVWVALNLRPGAPPEGEASEPSETASGIPTETEASPPAITVDELETLKSRLTSGDEGEVSRLVGLPEGATVDEEGLLGLVAELETLDLDSEAASVVDEGVVTVPGRTEAGKWLFYLVEHDGEWRLAHTEETP